MSKFVGTGPLSYKKRIYRAVVSQRLRNTALNSREIIIIIIIVIIIIIIHFPYFTPI